MKSQLEGALLALFITAAIPGASIADDAPLGDCEHAEEPSSRAEVPKDLINDLVSWIAMNTDYDVSLVYRMPPEIAFCEIGDIVPYEDADLLVEPALRAAYDLQSRRIHLVEPWSEERPYDVSVLLHELIHDVQLSNHDWECVGAPEFEAYWLQDKWLAEKGIRPGFDWEVIRRLSRCPPSDDG